MRPFSPFLAFFFAALLLSCEKPHSWVSILPAWIKNKTANQASTATGGYATTLHVDQTNEALRLVSLDARNTLPFFFRHLLNPAKDESNFCIKYPFRTDDGSGFSMEQLWLTGISFKDGVYYGVLTNNPFYIASMKKGDTVSFSADEITDWMYLKNGNIIGGLSINYLLEQIPEYELSNEQQEILQMFER